jgi:DNA polymerase
MDEPLPPISNRALRQRLESLLGAGVTDLPRHEGRRIVPPAAHADGSPAPQMAAPSAVPLRLTSAPVAVSSAPSLEVLRSEVAACTACEELAQTRTQTVFGVGNPSARLCFLGEAPGADEDRLGEPFVGRAGQLLDLMIKACTLSRDEVYILNVLKCRPPGNRNPTPGEASNCRGFLTRQLELINPEYVCCLGAVAAQNFLATETPIGRLRGVVHHHAGRKVVCTYHPAYLLRNPSAKKQAWDDLKLLMREMGVTL